MSDKRKYQTPKVTDLGELATLTLGSMASSNDGGGGGAGMAGPDIP
jgi:hypothetical protein